ncbi:hypothetical protein HYH03_000996 [Edaphochlamys debaryana]|uniref:Uncharacterized protein n=1 Tax=Edaphochlamys debaryana TaxID=47281 RepID=A0A835YEP3_9CHLO|nr:hypothetical protein HYH03_000996 [Edaphochlamys debaryana]|eukprot:KAG2501181.1 hypothetical protein HYH03_000996 [Edaphochlamys debaryana]
MSRRKADLQGRLHWTRRPATGTDQFGTKPQDAREDVPLPARRPHTAAHDGRADADQGLALVSASALAAAHKARPHTSLGLQGRSRSLSTPQAQPSSVFGGLMGQPSRASLASRGSGTPGSSLPPLARTTAAGWFPSSPSAPSTAPSTANLQAAVPNEEGLAQLHDALSSSQPHNATARLLRLGTPGTAGGRSRRSASPNLGPPGVGPLMAGPSVRSMTPGPLSQQSSRAQSPPLADATWLLPGVAATLEAAATAVSTSTGAPLLPSQHSRASAWGTWGAASAGAAPRPSVAASAAAAAASAIAYVSNSTSGEAPPTARAIGVGAGAGGGGGGSPPRSGTRSGQMLEDARRLAAQAAEVLYANELDVSVADKAAAATALQQLEALLGRKEVASAALGQATRSLKADVGRELHLASDKAQMSYARAQLVVLDRHHQHIRRQLHPGPSPDPSLPAPAQPTAAEPSGQLSASALMDDVAGDAAEQALRSQMLGSQPSSEVSHLQGRGGSQSLMGATEEGEAEGEGRPGLRSASHSPSQSPPHSVPYGSPPASPGRRGQATRFLPSPNPRSPPTHPQAAWGPGAAGARGGSGGGSGTGALGPLISERSLGAWQGSPGGGPRGDGPNDGWRSPPGTGTGTGAGLGTGEGGDPRYNLAEAMERTAALRVLRQAEAALAAVAMPQCADWERPTSSVTGEGGAALDVEELRLLKHDQPPSYMGVNVRRAPTPLPTGGEASHAIFAGRSGSGSGSGPAAAYDPGSVLQWSNRGVSTAKMPQLREVLSTSPNLVRLCLGGNKLHDQDVSELMSILSEPAAPRVRTLELDLNTNLTWRCALPLALALGLSPDTASAAAADWAVVAAALPPNVASPAAVVAPSSVPSATTKVKRLGLERLSLVGVKLGDKGCSQLAEGLRSNNTLRDLDLRRCGLSDFGGAALLEVLGSNVTLARLDVSWNALRSESARTLEVALAGNAGLRELVLANNGFQDVDGARIVKGLLNHGKWLRTDLSHNTLGPGACMMVAELLRRLGESAAALVESGAYTEGWGEGSALLGSVGSAAGLVPPGSPGKLAPPSGNSMAMGVRPASVNSVARPGSTGADGPERSSPSARMAPPNYLGSQLRLAPLSLALDGNPLGNTGLRIILDGMEAMSRAIVEAAELPPPDPNELEGPPEGLPPSPLRVTVSGCNVAPPSERSSGDHDEDDVNPFLPSISALLRPGGAGDGKAGGKDAAGKRASGTGSPQRGAKTASKGKQEDKEARVSSSVASHLTLASPHLDLASPAGCYTLDLSHPATSVLVAYLQRLRERLASAVAEGRASGVSLTLCDISVNGRPVRAEQLSNLDNWSEGSLQLTVKAPAQLALEPPAALSHLVAQWLCGLLADPQTSPLWKLSVVQAAGGVCFFTPGQCTSLLAGFDRDTESTECLSAAQVLYARSAQPLAFWRHVLPRFTPPQQDALRGMVGDLVALDLSRPMGRYNLNLSRLVDRFVALRLQLASALERSWQENKYFINWLNASFNGQPLDRAGLTRIRDFTLPGAGVLRLDYVSYEKPSPTQQPASSDELEDLLAVLRGCNVMHIGQLLQVRKLAIPPPPPPRPETARGAGALSRRKPPPAPPPPPPPRMPMLDLLRTPLHEVAMRLAKPGPPAWQPPDANGQPAPPPPPPATWAASAAFNAEPFLRRAGLIPPECSFSGYTLPEPSDLGSQPTASGSGVSHAAGALSRATTMKRGSIPGAKLAAEKEKEKAEKKGGKGKGKKGGKGEDKGGADGGDDWERAMAEYHAALLLLVHQAKDVPTLASKMGLSHLSAALNLLLRADGGARAVAVLMAALTALTAIKFLYDLADPSPCLLPQETRKQVLLLLPPERTKALEAVARGASEAAVARTRRIRTALNMWAAQRYVSSQQLSQVMRTVHYESDRVVAMVVLWPRVAGGGWKSTFERLTPSEQRQVMMRLGYWHVYTCLADPHGIAFALDLGEPEQRDIARELVRMAVKETARAKQDAKARGGGGGPVQTLLDLHGNGNPVSIPEDEKLWGMAESNFRTMDFLYCPTFEQSLARVTKSVVAIQRFWAAIRARRLSHYVSGSSSYAQESSMGESTSASMA